MEAPIILFTYKRLESLKICVESLKVNPRSKKSALYVFSDGPKTEVDHAQVESVRSFLKTLDGFEHIFLFESPINMGLARSVISGTSRVLAEHKKAIILEDDLKATPNFLDFMNDALEYYENSPSVFSISGFSFNLEIPKNFKEDAYFLNRAWSWGWATWSDRWQSIDWSVSDYLEFRQNRRAMSDFARGGSDLNRMLRRQMNGELDSWAIRWMYHQYKVGGLTLYPIISKIQNIGFDEHATHTTKPYKRFEPVLDKSNQHAFSFSNLPALSIDFQKQFNKKMGVWTRTQEKLSSIITRLVRK